MGALRIPLATYSPPCLSVVSQEGSQFLGPKNYQLGKYSPCNLFYFTNHLHLAGTTSPMALQPLTTGREGGKLTFPYNRVQSHVIVLLQLLTLSSPFPSLIRALVFRLS